MMFPLSMSEAHPKTQLCNHAVAFHVSVQLSTKKKRTLQISSPIFTILVLILYRHLTDLPYFIFNRAPTFS